MKKDLSNLKRKDISTLLILKARQQQIKNDIEKEKEHQHNVFAKKNQSDLRAMDCIFVFLFILNCGTTIMTNAMVAQNTPDIQFVEVNLVRATTNNLQVHPNPTIAWDMFKGLATTITLWTILTTFYVMYRRTISSNEGLLLLTALLITWSVTMTWDFANDLGYIVGTIWT